MTPSPDTVTPDSPAVIRPGGTDKRNQTLDQFSADVNAHYGRTVGFAAAVRGLYAARARVKDVTTHRDAAYAAIKEQFEARGGGPLVVALSGGGMRRAVIVAQTNSPSVRETVPAAAVEKEHRAAWAAARVLKRRVMVTAPRGHTPAGAASIIHLLPPLATGSDDLATLVGLYQHPTYKAVLDVLREEEAAAVTTLDKLAAEVGWDGEPISFKDGWKAQLCAWQYDAARLAVNDPGLYAQLARTVTSGGGTRLKFLDESTALRAGVLDADGE